MTSNFQFGDPVLILYDKKMKWLKKVEDKEFHCNYGMIKLGDIIGKEYGSKIKTHTGIELRLLSPTMIDWIDNFQHESQIIYPKDAAMISFLLDAKIGDIIYEAGTGSGALTAVLARIVGKTGKIVTYEIRNKAQKIAKKNLDLMGIDNVEFHLRNIIEEGFVSGIADSVILDMGDPWRALEHVSKCIKKGGKIVLFQPTYQQLEKTRDGLIANKFMNIKAIELIEREIQLKKDAIRPSTRMIGHTGFLVSATFLGD